MTRKEAHKVKTETNAENVTLKDAASMLHCTIRTIQNAIKAGKLEPVRCGISRRAYYVTRASVEAITKGGAQ